MSRSYDNSCFLLQSVQCVINNSDNILAFYSWTDIKQLLPPLWSWSDKLHIVNAQVLFLWLCKSTPINKTEIWPNHKSSNTNFCAYIVFCTHQHPKRRSVNLIYVFLHSSGRIFENIWVIKTLRQVNDLLIFKFHNSLAWQEVAKGGSYLVQYHKLYNISQGTRSQFFSVLFVAALSHGNISTYWIHVSYLHTRQ